MYEVKFKFSAQLVADLITTAFEGGSNYWIDKVELLQGGWDPNQTNWYADESFFEKCNNFSFMVTSVDNIKYKIDFKVIQRAFEILACDIQYVVVFSHLLDPEGANWDASDADVFLQLCCFNELVYA